MIKSLLFLTALGLVHGLKEPHQGCRKDGPHQLLPHENDCTKYYYCENGEKFIEPRKCAPGTEFSSELQVCTHPASAKCSLDKGSPVDKIVDDSPAPVPGPQRNLNLQAALVPKFSRPPEDCERFENGCPVDFNYDEFFEHETYCRLFYRCLFGQKVLFKCARGTVFNIIEWTCDHPANVDRTCEDYESSEEDIPVNDEESKEIDFLENGCPVDSGVAWLLPHERYCNVYYHCNSGNKIWSICPPSTVFNPITQACDHTYNVDCEHRDALAVATTQSPAPTVPTTPRPNFEANENGCPINSAINWLLPHEDCTKFYQCVHGNLVEMMCASSLHFSPSLQRCENPAIAGCANGPCSEATDCSKESSEAGGNDTEEEKEPVTEPEIVTEEEKEPVTEPEIVTEEEKEPVTEPEIVTEEEKEPVTEPEIVTEEEKEPVTEPEIVTEEEKEPVTEPEIVTEEEKEPVTEPEIVTEEEKEPVTEPEIVTEEEKEPVTEPEIVTEEEKEPVTEPEIVTEEEKEPVTEPEDVTEADEDETKEDIVNDDEDCDKTEEDKKCEEECHVQPWAHEDCDKFWICYDNKAKLIVCANGLYFNPVTKTCDFECNVPCESSKSRVSPHRAGLNMYIPWGKLDKNAEQLIKLIKAN